MIRVVLICVWSFVVSILLAGCSEPSDESYPGAFELGKLASSSAVLFEAQNSLNACETSITSYGTEDDVEAVVDHFESGGFEEKGKANVINGETVRWVGELPGEEDRWTHIDISRGDIAGNERWSTVFEIARPACR
jgi:hypothetical protein